MRTTVTAAAAMTATPASTPPAHTMTLLVIRRAPARGAEPAGEVFGLRQRPVLAPQVGVHRVRGESLVTRGDPVRARAFGDEPPVVFGGRVERGDVPIEHTDVGQRGDAEEAETRDDRRVAHQAHVSAHSLPRRRAFRVFACSVSMFLTDMTIWPSPMPSSVVPSSSQSSRSPCLSSL